ncbi:adenylosuccinate synthetase [Galactobacter caseinivorans]|uniref:Adenylosuccinate synthetase n=1 Tax=Galactobacter caseinivorans TaxID=2676123 RepID=A0A496PJI4_9MICC|nr:adenylosuccinate synthetase [Galactobacter caseinivorans]RKW70627.1 adenylosuccinate synthetase [Galactobacter caseinivorans]
MRQAQGRPRADIVVGLGWGDEGKGATVDALAAGPHPADRVVRFNGGQQAAHTVVAGGLKHTFSTFGAGTLAGVPSWVGPDCTFAPLAAAAEATALRALGLRPDLSVSADALITTPLHVAANLAREAARGGQAHGTTGTGFGETIGLAERLVDAGLSPLRAGDLVAGGPSAGGPSPGANPAADAARTELVAHRLELMVQELQQQGLTGVEAGRDALARLARRLVAALATSGARVRPTEDLLQELSHGYTIFEGAQGFGLDENFGAQPHTTWSTTTPAPARALCRASGVEQVRAIGCLRSYATRHGAGPLPGEGALPFAPPEPDNRDDGAQGAFRTGAWDPALVRWAVRITGVEAISVSHTDVFARFMSTEGELALDTFGPLAMVANGPQREARVLRGGS